MRVKLRLRIFRGLVRGYRFIVTFRSNGIVRFSLTTISKETQTFPSLKSNLLPKRFRRIAAPILRSRSSCTKFHHQKIPESLCDGKTRIEVGGKIRNFSLSVKPPARPLFLKHRPSVPTWSRGNVRDCSSLTRRSCLSVLFDSC